MCIRDRRHYEKLSEYATKLEEYVEKIKICGEERNSYSKTDHSATFMRIKTEDVYKRQAEKWIALMKQYVNPVELTAELLNTLIEKITVHEAVKGEDGSREQEVEIYYRFIGKID